MIDEEMSRAAGMAALSVCEALALALVEDGLLDREHAARAIEDAAAAHRNAERETARPDMHRMAAEMVEMIRKTVEVPAHRH